MVNKFKDETAKNGTGVNPSAALRILFAHNDNLVLNMISDMFELQSGHGTFLLDVANSDKQLLQKLSESIFDIIVIDNGISGTNIVKILSDLKQARPSSKIIFLVDVFDDETNRANNLSVIQYFKKPFTQKKLIECIQNTAKNSMMEMNHFCVADLLLLQSNIKQNSALSIVNKETESSAEIVFDTKEISFACVKKGNINIFGELALDEVLRWKSFESSNNGISFSNELNISNGSLETIYEYLQSERHEQLIKNEFEIAHIVKKHISLSAEAQQHLRELLAHVPQKVNEKFVMNAFCDNDYKLLVQLKNPRYNQTLYTIGHSIQNGLKAVISNSNASSEKYYTYMLPNSNIMGLHQIDDSIWYFTILNKTKKLPKYIIDLVNKFSISVPTILNSTSNVYSY